MYSLCRQSRLQFQFAIGGGATPSLPMTKLDKKLGRNGKNGNNFEIPKFRIPSYQTDTMVISNFFSKNV